MGWIFRRFLQAARIVVLEIRVAGQHQLAVLGIGAGEGLHQVVQVFLRHETAHVKEIPALPDGNIRGNRKFRLRHPIVYSRPLKSPFLRDTVSEKYLAEMGFLRAD